MAQTVSIPSLNLGPLVQGVTQKSVDFYPYAITYAKGALSFLILLSIPLSLFFLIVIVYCVEGEDVFILRVVHGKRQLEELFLGDP